MTRDVTLDPYGDGPLRVVERPASTPKAALPTFTQRLT